MENSEKDRNTRPPDLASKKSVCRSKSNNWNQTWKNRLVPIGKGVCQGCILSPCLFNLYAEYSMHKLESRFPGEISITSDMQMSPPLWQKAQKN